MSESACSGSIIVEIPEVDKDDKMGISWLTDGSQTHIALWTTSKVIHRYSPVLIAIRDTRSLISSCLQQSRLRLRVTVTMLFMYALLT